MTGGGRINRATHERFGWDNIVDNAQTARSNFLRDRSQLLGW